MELKNNIINTFKNLSFNEKYGNDITITIVLIILSIFITAYFIILGTIKSQKAVWENNKCNPLFMPFASIINDKHDQDGKYKKSFTEDNFNECLNELNYEVGDNFKTPINGMMSFVMGIFNFGKVIIDQIFSFFIYLLNLILTFLKFLLDQVYNLYTKSKVIMSHFMSLIANIMDTFDILKLTLMYMIDFLKYSLFLTLSSISVVFVLPAITSFVILSVLAAISMVLAIIFGWFIPGLIATAVATRVFAILAMIFMVFTIVIHTNINRGTTRIVEGSGIL